MLALLQERFLVRSFESFNHPHSSLGGRQLDSPWLIALGLVISSGLYVGLPAGVLYLGLRFVRAKERLSIGSTETAKLTARVSQLEDQLEALSSSVEQIAEGQRFTTAMLTDRTGGGDESRR